MAFTKGKGLSSINWLFLVLSTLIMSACGGGNKAVNKEPPVAIIATLEGGGVAPFKASFDGDGSSSPNGQVTSYEWTFPDGTVQSGSQVSYTFTDSGTQNVQLMIEDEAGLSASTSLDINVVSLNDRFSIQGKIKSMPFTATDGDVNDPKAPYFNNDGDTEGNIQDISNPIRLNGFASRVPTNWNGDRFASSTDTEDHFRVRLNEKDFVSVLIADYIDSDLDLYLFKESTMELVAYSAASTEYESLQATESGDYIVVVEAVEGYSNYMLRVGRNSYLTGIAALGNSADFEADQVVLKMADDSDPVVGSWYPDKAQMSLSHRQSRRAVLAKINPLNPQTHNMLWGRVMQKGFKKRLSHINLKASQKLDTIKAIKHLKKQIGVEFAEPNYRVQPFLTPRDPLFVYQWHLHSLNMRAAWDISTGDPEVVIAVVDTGVYLNHPDLQNQLVDGYDFVSNAEESNDGDGIDSDPTDPGDSDTIAFSSFHGTHVTGIAVGELNNGIGIVGVAPNSKVMPVRAIGSEGGLMYDILQAVRFASGLENDSGTVPAKAADVINLSLGGPGYSQAPLDLFKLVREKGIVVVASSGNQNTGEAMYPASYPGVISVGAAQLSGERAYYSNTGINVDVLAYGGNMDDDTDNDGSLDGILSSMVFGGRNDAPDPDYSYIDGTSMSAPQVAAIVALMKSTYPGLTPELFDSLLYSGELTIDKGEPGRDDEYGYGLIDGLMAVEAAQNLRDGGLTSAVTTNRPSLLFDEATQELSVDVEAIGNGSISITSVSVNAPWLSVNDQAADSSGLGRYKVSTSLDPDEFSDGTYRAYIEFETDQNTSLQIEVIARVGLLSEAGDAGFIYILLIDTESGELVDSVDMSPEDGIYEYSFDEVRVGSYYVTAGSDIDNNGLICDYGETCGSYPKVDSFEIFDLFGDRTDIDFEVGLYTTSDIFGMQKQLNKKRTQN